MFLDSGPDSVKVALPNSSRMTAINKLKMNSKKETLQSLERDVRLKITKGLQGMSPPGERSISLSTRTIGLIKGIQQ